MVMSPQLAVVEAPRTRRIPRTPTHSFYLQTRPYGIYPFCIAPVLPGETLKSLLLQSRVVTDPVASPLVGWWTEYYFFYVKLRQLPDAVKSAVETMILDPSANLSAVADSTERYRQYFAPGAGNAVPWQRYCLETVTKHYFRDESEAWNNYMTEAGEIPLAKFNDSSWRDSLFATSELPTDTVDDGDTFTEFELKYRTWLLLRQQQMTDLTFEDYLATFGVHVAGNADPDKPELLRFVRDWAYPSNTVDPTTGVPTSAVSWSVAERADKDRFFTEPGFIFGVTVCRPKTYCAWQKQAAVCMLDNAFAWMPAILKDDPSSSLREFASADPSSPLNSDFSSAHTLDIRDLYIYGDQFLNTPDPIVDIQGDVHVIWPQGGTHAGMQYPDGTDVQKLWADRSTTEPEYTATKVYIRQDGIVKLNILGTQMDQT